MSGSATFPAPASSIITPQFLQRLRDIVGADRLLDAPDELVVYECDGYVVEKNTPDVVVFPINSEEVVRIVLECNRFQIPFVARGAGTSLAGGCLPVGGGVMIALTKMNRILEINLRDRYAIVEPGCVNLRLTRSLAGSGFHYAPDPSSQGACTIGGNVATNSGGPHTLKYGVTVNHILGVEYVSADGQLIQLGGPCGRGNEFDLTGLFVGSEGTFGGGGGGAASSRVSRTHLPRFTGEVRFGLEVTARMDPCVSTPRRCGSDRFTLRKSPPLTSGML